MTIVSFASFGYEGEIIKVEADLRRGLPIIDIVGLPGSAVKEARERMRAAITNSHLPFPQERILINLSPADQRKEGSGFDLPIALAVLQADRPLDTPVMVIGELELSGKVRPVRGVLGAMLSGAAAGIEYFIVPKESRKAYGYSALKPYRKRLSGYMRSKAHYAPPRQAAMQKREIPLEA